MSKLLLCTGNVGKLAELRALLPSGMELLSLTDAGLTTDLPETGDTFTANALQKARFAFERTGIPCIADDSGLEVEALGGAPGVFSARYAGEAKGDAANMAKLLREMEGVEDRSARFLTVVALIDKHGEHTFEGSEGRGHIGTARLERLRLRPHFPAGDERPHLRGAGCQDEERHQPPWAGGGSWRAFWQNGSSATADGELRLAGGEALERQRVGTARSDQSAAACGGFGPFGLGPASIASGKVGPSARRWESRGVWCGWDAWRSPMPPVVPASPRRQTLSSALLPYSAAVPRR